MKSIVTGGCGFIGSHMVDKLLENGHEVIVIDNLSTGRKANLDHQKDNKNLKIVVADIREIEDVREYFQDVDYVFHMAALADIVPSIQNPDAYFSSNVIGSYNVAQCCKDTNVKKVLYTASSSCYGIPDHFPTSETAEIRPQYPYALTKSLGEQTMLHWGQVYNFPVISLRLFNVYGVRSRTNGTYGAVFGVFLAQKLAKTPYTVVGDGKQTRDFTYVTDIVDAFYAASISDVSNEIFNVGSGDTYSVNQLVELLGGEKTYIPKRPGEPDCTFADIRKIQERLKWSPKITLQEGVAKILENIDYWKEAPVWTPDSIEGATKDWFKYLGKEN